MSVTRRILFALGIGLVGTSCQLSSPPIALPDAVNLESPRPVTIDVLANDFSAEGELEVIKTTDVLGGFARIDVDGTVVFTPEAGFVGPASFSYVASDGVAESDSAVVTISIADIPIEEPDEKESPIPDENRHPVAVNDTYEVRQGSTITGDVTANDSDPDGDRLFVNAISDTAHGRLELGLDGGFSYVHDGSETTEDSFEYRLEDGEFETFGSVLLVIVPVEDGPKDDDKECEGFIEVDTTPIDFGSVPPGAPAVDRRVVVNQTSCPIESVDVFLVNWERFGIESSCGSLDVGEACSIGIQFFAEEPGEYRDVLVIENSAIGLRAQVEVHGIVQRCEGSIEVDTTPIDFGSVPPGAPAGDRRVVVNQTSCPIESVDVFLVNWERFGIESSCGSLDVGEACSIGIQFFTEEPGEYRDVLVIENSALGLLARVEVHGIVERGTSVLRAVPPDVLDLGKGDSVHLSSSGTVPIEIAAIELESGEAFAIVEPFCPLVLAPQESCDVHLFLFDRSTEGRREDVLLIRHSGDNPDYAIQVFTFVIN